MEFVTLTKDDPDFERYLLGTFARDRRALPIETYHAQTYRERVTFRVLPLAQLGVPHWTRVFWSASRPELVALTLGPSLSVWIYHAGEAAWRNWSAWAALAGVLFLHVAAFVFNDVQDHVRGSDRLNRRRGSRVIQNGWTTAADMRRWARVNLALAVVCGLPTFVVAPVGLSGVTLAAAAALGVLVLNLGVRRGLGDLALAALFGPLLTTGVALASVGRVAVGDVALGVAFGLTSLWVFQVRQFENLFRAKPEGFRTFLGHLNFDGARLTCVFEGAFLLALLPAAAVLTRVPLVFLFVLPLFAVPLILRIARIYHAASPLSSDLVNSSRGALIAHCGLTAWWMLSLSATWL